MYLKSIRLSRLTKLSAWRNFSNWIPNIVLLFLAGFLICFSKEEEPAGVIMGCLALIAVGICLPLQILRDVCGPAETFKLNNGRVRVCVYRSKSKHMRDIFELIIHKDGESLCLPVEEYDVSFKTSDAGCFIYREANFREARDNNKNWLVWRADTEDARVLGTRLNKILFLASEKKDCAYVLNKSGEVQQIKVDYFVYDDICIPKGSDLCYAERNEKPKFPDEFLLVRQNKSYKSYGFYLSGDTPQCREIIISSIIFREGLSRVLLVYDEDLKQYQERFRSRSDLFRRLSEYFVVTTENYRVGGKVYHYDGRREKLSEIYEGDFLSIDFVNGQVLGSDGKIYGGDDDNNDVFINL